jgi:hypothetical protein
MSLPVDLSLPDLLAGVFRTEVHMACHAGEARFAPKSPPHERTALRGRPRKPAR